MDNLLIQLQRAGIRWEKNVSLSEHSSFRIGGCADLALFPNTKDSLTESLTLLKRAKIPMLVIGRGSNVVFSDCGFRGAVVFTSCFRTVSVENTSIVAGAGALLSTVANAARDASLSGAEFAYGIPGTLGGAVFMNAGAFGGCMADICVSSEYFDLDSGEIGVLAGDAQGFGTRTSIYQSTSARVILSARLSLTHGIPRDINDKMKDFLDRRKATQPLEFPSAGSVFKRPVGHFAGKLIEDCGLKGMRIGGAEVSEKHAGFIINRGGATAEDVRRLTELIRERIQREYGITLECEIRFL